MFPVTESKEIWPALLAKAMLKTLGPEHETRLFTDPLCKHLYLSFLSPYIYTPICMHI
jgi:hypothetical protein